MNILKIIKKTPKSLLFIFIFCFVLLCLFLSLLFMPIITHKTIFFLLSVAFLGLTATSISCIFEFFRKTEGE